MRPTRRSCLLALLTAPLCLPAGETAVSSLELTDLNGSATWPAPLQKLISYALSLTKKNLSYQFGSADPALGGMDCSGTIYHVLGQTGNADLPRQADGFFHTVKAAGTLHPVSGTPTLDDAALAMLKPGHLLFWTGTYGTGDAAKPISHVMLYLGKTTAGKPVMFGASDGRPYEGKRRNGVSVFDFKVPAADSKSRFVGYVALPGWDFGKVAAVPPG